MFKWLSKLINYKYHPPKGQCTSLIDGKLPSSYTGETYYFNIQCENCEGIGSVLIPVGERKPRWVTCPICKCQVYPYSPKDIKAYESRREKSNDGDNFFYEQAGYG